MARIGKNKGRSGYALTEYCNLIQWRPTSVYVVGVGIRYCEVTIMRDVWNDLNIYGFEPNPDTCRSIKKKFPGTLFEMAVGAKPAQATLYSKRLWKDGSTMFKPENEEWQEKTVPVTTLDLISSKLPAESPRSCLLWLDCEGSEYNVLNGGEHFLNSVGVINVEMTAKPRISTWSHPADVHSFLKKHGFHQAWIHTIRTCIGQYDAIYVHKSIYNKNFSCCPGEYPA